MYKKKSPFPFQRKYVALIETTYYESLEAHYLKHKTTWFISSRGIKVRISQPHTETQVICFKTAATQASGSINHTGFLFLLRTESTNRIQQVTNVLCITADGEIQKHLFTADRKVKSSMRGSLSLSLGRPPPQDHSLNFHSCRHMGHCCWTCCEFSHFKMQCMWKQWEH